MVLFDPMTEVYCQKDEVSTVCTLLGRGMGLVLALFGTVLALFGTVLALFYPYLPVFNPYLPVFTRIYPYLPVFNPYLPVFTRIYPYSECVLRPLGSPWRGLKRSYVHVPVVRGPVVPCY